MSSDIPVEYEKIGHIGQVGDGLYEAEYLPGFITGKSVDIIDHDNELALLFRKRLGQFFSYLFEASVVIDPVAERTDGIGYRFCRHAGSGKGRKTGNQFGRAGSTFRQFAKPVADVGRYLGSNRGRNLAEECSNKILLFREPPWVETNDDRSIIGRSVVLRALECIDCHVDRRSLPGTPFAMKRDDKPVWSDSVEDPCSNNFRERAISKLVFLELEQGAIRTQRAGTLSVFGILGSQFCSSHLPVRKDVSSDVIRFA